jgi:glucuronate isomerase
VPYRPDTKNETDGIFKKALAGEQVSFEETEIYKTALLLFLGREYARLGWVMQLHYGAIRNANTAMFKNLGPDTGYDCIALTAGNRNIAQFLDALAQTGELPKTIIYSLNPSDDEMLGSMIGCFQNADAVGKIQHGSAWWFNDTKDGMEKQLRSLASQSILGNFVGMLTDSRSFLSYARHEYFRRILCNLLGGWVENGEYPNDIKAVGKIVQDISYNNAVRYFGF